MKRFIALGVLAGLIITMAPAQALPPLIPRYVVAAQEPGASGNGKRFIPGNLGLSGRTGGSTACPHVATALGTLNNPVLPSAAREVVRTRSCAQADYVDIVIRNDRSGIELFTLFNADTVAHNIYDASGASPWKFWSGKQSLWENAPPGDFMGIFFAGFPEGHAQEGQLRIWGSANGTLHPFKCSIHSNMSGNLRVFLETPPA